MTCEMGINLSSSFYISNRYMYLCSYGCKYDEFGKNKKRKKILTPKYLHQPMQKLCRTLAGFASTIYTIRFHSHLHLSFQIRKQHVLLLVAL